MGNKTLNIGMIGLDTSHAVAFARLLHDENHPHHVPGGRVICAWPGGSPDFELSISRVGRFARELSEHYGVRIVDSPERVAELSDAVMLESADGRVHPEQFRRIAPYGKPVFIDKPLAVSVRDAEEILRLAERYRVPVMSGSALRFVDGLAAHKTCCGDGVQVNGWRATGAAVTGGPDAGGRANGVVVTGGPDADGRANGVAVTGGLVAGGYATGADVFGPMPFSPPQPGYFWYGIHGAEMLYAILGPGCERVSAIPVGDHDLIVGAWADGRIGTVRGNRVGPDAFGALIHRTDRTVLVEPPAELTAVYAALLRRVLEMFRTGRPAVGADEMLEIIRFLEAANESRESGGKWIRIGMV